MTFRRLSDADRIEHKRAQLLMLKAVLATCLKNVMKDGLRADTILVNHIGNAHVRVQQLLEKMEGVNATTTT